jgi:hypothetical protein
MVKMRLDFILISPLAGSPNESSMPIPLH